MPPGMISEFHRMHPGGVLAPGGRADLVIFDHAAMRAGFLVPEEDEVDVPLIRWGASL